MKKNFVRCFHYLALIVLFAVAASLQANGQSNPVSVTPTTLYRFLISSSDGGYLLTGIYQEGVANNYFFQGPIFAPGDGPLGLYIPPSGYTPAPASGLVPLHRWLVIQDGWRNYYYFSTFYSTQGSDYHYQGIAGYVFPPGTTSHQFTGIDGNGQANVTVSLHQLSVFYSQNYGYWNGYGASGFGFVESPPNGTYAYHGNLCAVINALDNTQNPLPPSSVPHVWDVLFYPPPPPPPPPPCDASQAIKAKCAQLGGWWDDETCSCQY